MRILRLIGCCLLSAVVWTASARSKKDLFLTRQAVPFARAQLAFPDSIRIWAFGALHGSAKTEQAELLLLEKLLEQRDTVWYFPETDFSTAHYFEAYLRTGDDRLLERIIREYGWRVPQERTVEVFEKWRRLRRLVNGKRFRVVGIDPVCSPVFAMQYLLDSVQDERWVYRKPLRGFLETSPEIADEGFRALLAEVLADYERRRDYYAQLVADTASLGYVIRSLQSSEMPRECVMFSNYRQLNGRYGFRRGVQMVRMGVGHILLQEEDDWKPLLMRLMEKDLYRRSEICVVQAFLTRSRVLWDVRYDAAGKYTGYATRGGWGVSDSWRERFRGIGHLKRHRRGEMTFFDLRGPKSPYAEAGCMDLVVCRRLFGRTERFPEGVSTLDYLDAAVLIRSSRAAQPIEEWMNR